MQVENSHFIRFQMEDGDKSVTVHIATSWLRERASKDRRSSSNLKLLYNYYREMIEAAASAKYDLSHSYGADVVVVGSDLE